MANNMSAEKNIRKNMKRNLHNRQIISKVRTSIKTLEKSIQDENKTEAVNNFNIMVKLIDSATRKGLFHKNTAARKKSRLHKALNSIT